MLAAALIALTLAAPGRVAVAEQGGRIHDVPALASGGAVTVSLPDGGAQFIAAVDGDGPALVTLSRRGAVASKGPALKLAGEVHRLVRLPDGRLLAVIDDDDTVSVVRVLPDGSLDAAYGDGGVAHTMVSAACGGACDDASATPDGSILVAGTTGGTPSTWRWVVARITAQGTLDPAFGDHGVATLPGEPATGVCVAALADGSALACGQVGGLGHTKIRFARLDADGSVVGAPVETPLEYGFATLVHLDGAFDIAGHTGGGVPTPTTLLRYDAAGALKQTVTLGPDADRLFELPDDALLALGEGRIGTLAARLVHGDGSLDDALPRTVAIPILGAQVEDVVRRPDGGFLVPAGTGVTRINGDEYLGITGFGFAALTDNLKPDTSFGGRAAKPRVRIRVERQSASDVRSLRRLQVTVRACAACVVDVRGHVGTRRVSGTIAVLSGGGHDQMLTVQRPRGLRPGARVRLRATVRNLVLATAHASDSGRLR